MIINSRANVISLFANAAVKGPVIISQGFDNELQTEVEMLEFEVANKTRIPTNLPFGLLVTVLPGNINKTRMRVRVGPGFYTVAGVAWPQLCHKAEKLTEFIAEAVICTKVVPNGFDLGGLSQTLLWESSLNPIDSRHSLLTTVYVLERNPVTIDQTEGVFGGAVLSTQSLVNRGEVVGGALIEVLVANSTDNFWALSAGFTLNEARQLSENWWVINNRQVLSTAFVANGQDYSTAYDQRQKVSVHREEVTTGDSAIRGLYVASSSVTPRNDGVLIRETASVVSWDELAGSRWDEQLNIQIGFTEQFVAPPATFTGNNTEFQIVNQDRSLKRVEVVPSAALAAYADVVPVRVELRDLPRELIEIRAVWNQSSSVGTQDYAFEKIVVGDNWSLAGDTADQASSAAAITADIQLKFRDLATGNLFGKRHQFYLPNPVTLVAILTRLGTAAHENATVVKWPVFKPESDTITATGQSIRVACNVSVGLNAQTVNSTVVETGKYHGESDDFAVSLSNNSIQLPLCIHGALAIVGDTSRSQAVTATALVAMYHTAVGTVTATKAKTGTAYGVITPATLNATEGVSSIPTTGLYLLDLDVRRDRWDYSMITAIVFDASNLA